MSSSTSSSRLFLASIAAGLALTGAAFSLADESYFHTGPEFGMNLSMEDRLKDACARKAAPDLLILGDSRAVAGLSAQQITASGITVEKFAMGGSGIFVGYALLDRLLECGVRPRQVVMAYGVIHLIDSGAVMDRTTNFGGVSGSNASRSYSHLSDWEGRPARAAAYKAVSIAGTGPTLVDLVLLRPSLRGVLEAPAHAIENYRVAQAEREKFTASMGDRFYGEIGLARYRDPLPEEALHQGGINPINTGSAKAIADLARKHGVPMSLYVLPMSETAITKVDERIYDLARDMRGQLSDLGVTPLNDVWSLPDTDFGDPSHVNATGREKTTADFLSRLSVSGAAAVEMNYTETVGPQVVDQAG
jgi:hypothetical protein